ncbi:MAG TPA: polysaccharide biosynthesis tyrosine autokinase, partial [Chitinophagaceae bacterium]|nr:polysaccharide biosynthesis tyrosine autokinase [Chitinophagaceae bacterium]
APVFEQDRIKDVSAYTSSPVIIETISPDSLVATDKVFFNYDSAKRNVIIQNNSYPLNVFVNTPYGILKFIPQNVSHIPVNPLYFTLVNPKNVASSLVTRLNITPASKLSSVLNLSFVDEVPKRSEDILNGLITAYNNAAIKEKNTMAANTLAFLDERLNAVGHDLDSIGQKLQHYKSNRGAIDISSQATSFLQNVSANDQKMGDVNLQLSVLNQIESYVKAKQDKGNLLPSTVGITDPQLPQLLNKLYDLQLQYETLKKTTGENNPIMVSINDQIEKIRPGILDNIRNQKESLQASINSLNSTNNQYSSVLQTIPQKERDLVDISREQNIKSNIYNFLLQKREETSLSLLSSIPDSRVVDMAQSSLTPVSPKTKLIYAIAVFLAFALALGIITANEFFGRTILFRHEIESYTSIPVIGEIVYEKSKNPLVIGNGKRTFIAEQFRSLRTSLPYIGLKADKKRLQVTSSVSGEGKSFVVANLGIGLAMTGKKVVVIEFDLSDPTLCEKLNAEIANKGLTDYLTGQAEPEEIIQKTSIHENLYIVPAGWLPENPSEMILSNKVPELMQYLSGIFDYIIIDTAPVGLLSDAYVLSSYCDATLYVVRHKHTRKASIQRLDENNRINELKNMAIIFNAVKSRGFGKYGYGYGYGYIYKEKKKKRKLFSKAGML